MRFFFATFYNIDRVKNKMFDIYSMIYNNKYKNYIKSKY